MTKKPTCKIANSVPEMLARLRESRKLNGRESAELAGISPPKWCCYEGGKELPTLRSLQRIADGFGVTLAVDFIDKRRRNAS